MRRYLGLKLMLAGLFVLLGSCGACTAAFTSFEGSAKGPNRLMTAAGIGFYVGVGLVLLGLVEMVVEVLVEWRRSGPKPDVPPEDD